MMRSVETIQLANGLLNDQIGVFDDSGEDIDDKNEFSDQEFSNFATFNKLSSKLPDNNENSQRKHSASLYNMRVSLPIATDLAEAIGNGQHIRKPRYSQPHSLFQSPLILEHGVNNDHDHMVNRHGHVLLQKSAR